MIEGRLPDGTVKRINTKDAEIFLAELPFIRLRDKLTIPLQGKGFKELVTEGQKDLDIATIQQDKQGNQDSLEQRPSSLLLQNYKP